MAANNILFSNNTRRLQKFSSDRFLSDVNIEFVDKNTSKIIKLSAHKIILSTYSDFFYKLFTYECKQNTPTTRIIIPYADTAELIIRSFYAGELLLHKVITRYKKNKIFKNNEYNELLNYLLDCHKHISVLHYLMVPYNKNIFNNLPNVQDIYNFLSYVSDKSNLESNNYIDLANSDFFKFFIGKIWQEWLIIDKKLYRGKNKKILSCISKMSNVSISTLAKSLYDSVDITIVTDKRILFVHEYSKYEYIPCFSLSDQLDDFSKINAKIVNAVITDALGNICDNTTINLVNTCPKIILYIEDSEQYEINIFDVMCMEVTNYGKVSQKKINNKINMLCKSLHTEKLSYYLMNDAIIHIHDNLSGDHNELNCDYCYEIIDLNDTQEKIINWSAFSNRSYCWLLKMTNMLKSIQ